MKAPLLVLFVLLTACATPTGDNLVSTMAIPPDMTLDQISEVVASTAVRRKWEIRDIQEGSVKLQLIHRGFEANLLVSFDTEELRIYSDSWKIRSSGRRIKRKDPEGWIANLEKDLRVFLARARFS